MFKKLKDKIAEEVKQSPLKSVQQFAQSVVSPSSSSVFEPSSSNDKFCIEEGDVEETGASAPAGAGAAKPGGFTSVSLTGQISPPSREPKHSVSTHQHDMDNFFPVFESQATNFHVQSDWESASEVEDRYSQLEHINKESLYEAYRKVYNRYNKVKNKYHELVTHYRHLEREKEKAKTVLTETQDKALLRISELRDQCQLEQQAKAHLEEALRNELEERDHIINTLKTKVDYLKGLSDSSVVEPLDSAQELEKNTRNLIDFTAESCVSNVPLPPEASFSKENLESYLEKMKENLKTHLSNLEHLNTQWQEHEKQAFNESDSSSGTVTCDSGTTEEERSQSKHSITCQSQITLIRQLIEDVGYLQLISNELMKKHSLEDGNVIDISEKSSRKEVALCLNCQNSEHTLRENEFKVECDNLQIRMKDLELENQSLSQKLVEESLSAKTVKTDLNCLNQTLDVVKTFLKTVTDNINDGINEWVECDNSISMDDELSKHLNFLMNNLFNSRSELERTDNLRINLENEVKSLKDSIKMTTQDKQVMQDLVSENNKLQDEYNKVLNENNVSQNGLNKEIMDLKKFNNELRNQIESLNHLLEANETEHNSRRETLELTNVNFNNEKIVLQNKISSLEADLKKLKDEYDSICKTKNDLLLQASVLNQEKDHMVNEKNILCGKISELENKYEQTRDESSKIFALNNKLRNELSSSKEEYNNLIMEKQLTHENCISLEKDLNDKLCESKLVLEEKLNLSKKVDILKEELENVTKERNNLQVLMEDLQSTHNNSEQEVRASKESENHLQEATLALKRELEGLKVDKRTLSTKVEDLEKSSKALKTEYDSLLVLNMNTSEELSLVKGKLETLSGEKAMLLNKYNGIKEDVQNKEQELLKRMHSEQNLNLEIERLKKEQLELVTEKHSLLDKIDKIENDLTNNAVQFSKLREINSKLTDEIDVVKSECSLKGKENIAINEKYNELVNSFDKYNANSSTLNETNTRLVNELTSLRQEHDNTISELNETQSLIESHKHTCTDLTKKLDDLTKAFNKQHDDMEQNQEENSKIKLEVDNLKKTINQSSVQLEHILSDKNSILNGLSSKLVKMRKLRNEQKNLLDFVLQFRAEMTNELNDVKLKLNNDFVSQVNTLIERNKVNDKLIGEMECKNKKDIDSYNSKLKHRQTEHPASDSTLFSSSGEESDSLSLNQLKKEKSLSSSNKKEEIQKLKQEVKLKDDIIKKLQFTVEQSEVKGIIQNHYPFEESVNPNLMHSKTMNCDINNDSNEYFDKYQQLAQEKRRHVEDIMSDFEKKGKLEEMEEQIENLQQDLEQRGDAFEKLYEEHQETVKLKNEEIDQLRFNYEREVREQDKKWRACLDRRLMEEERRREAEVARLNREWNTERKELVTASRLAVSAVESGSSSNDLLRRQVTALSLQLQNNRCEVCSAGRLGVGELDQRSNTSSASLQDCTEMEYLRNILYKYMLGKEPLVLCKVLCALMKFDEDQTKEVVLKEEQKITLLGQLGIL